MPEKISRSGMPTGSATPSPHPVSLEPKLAIDPVPKTDALGMLGCPSMDVPEVLVVPGVGRLVVPDGDDMDTGDARCGRSMRR